MSFLLRQRINVSRLLFVSVLLSSVVCWLLVCLLTVLLEKLWINDHEMLWAVALGQGTIDQIIVVIHVLILSRLHLFSMCKTAPLLLLFCCLLTIRIYNGNGFSDEPYFGIVYTSIILRNETLFLRGSLWFELC